MRDSNARITRWYLSMQPSRFTISHIPEVTSLLTFSHTCGRETRGGGGVCDGLGETPQERCPVGTNLPHCELLTILGHTIHGH